MDKHVLIFLIVAADESIAVLNVEPFDGSSDSLS
jgi:hypothetical protein